MRNDEINYLSILNKYQTLLIENDKLKAENKRLQAQLANLNSSNEISSKATIPVVTENVKGEVPSERLPVRTKSYSNS